MDVWDFPLKVELQNATTKQSFVQEKAASYHRPNDHHHYGPRVPTAIDRVPDGQKDHRDLQDLAEMLWLIRSVDHTTSGSQLFVAAHMPVQTVHSHVPSPMPANEGHRLPKDLMNRSLRHIHADGLLLPAAFERWVESRSCSSQERLIHQALSTPHTVHGSRVVLLVDKCQKVVAVPRQVSVSKPQHTKANTPGAHGICFSLSQLFPGLVTAAALLQRLVSALQKTS